MEGWSLQKRELFGKGVVGGGATERGAPEKGCGRGIVGGGQKGGCGGFQKKASGWGRLQKGVPGVGGWVAPEKRVRGLQKRYCGERDVGAIWWGGIQKRDVGRVSGGSRKGMWEGLVGDPEKGCGKG